MNSSLQPSVDTESLGAVTVLYTPLHSNCSMPRRIWGCCPRIQLQDHNLKNYVVPTTSALLDELSCFNTLTQTPCWLMSRCYCNTLDGTPLRSHGVQLFVCTHALLPCDCGLESGVCVSSPVHIYRGSACLVAFHYPWAYNAEFFPL